MTTELLSTFKAQAILDVHNHIATAQGKKPLAGWEKAKSALVARVFAMATSDEIESAIKATEDGPKPGKKEAPKAKAKKTAKGKSANKPGKTAPAARSKSGTGIGVLVRAILKASPEMPAIDVVAAVQKSHPEAKTSAACVGWYRSQMYKSGELVK